MIIKYITADCGTGNAKLTVHKTGKLGLSRSAMELLRTDENRFARFGYDGEGNLLLEISDSPQENAFPISKAGDYDYINARNLLDELGIDYTAPQTTIFDIRRTKEKGFFRLSERTIKK